jgi:hypothetical protein
MHSLHAWGGRLGQNLCADQKCVIGMVPLKIRIGADLFKPCGVLLGDLYKDGVSAFSLILALNGIKESQTSPKCGYQSISGQLLLLLFAA